MSASVGFENEIAGDDDADGEAWPDGEGRCDVELALDDLLAGLTDAIGGTLSQRPHDIAVLARRVSFGLQY